MAKRRDEYTGLPVETAPEAVEAPNWDDVEHKMVMLLGDIRDILLHLKTEAEMTNKILGARLG